MGVEVVDCGRGTKDGEGGVGGEAGEDGEGGEGGSDRVCEKESELILECGDGVRVVLKELV